MIGCLLIHGFTGSPYEVEPVAAHFAGRGWRIEMPVLAGHDNPPASMRQVTWQDWIKSAEIPLKDMLSTCDKVYLIGFSMGGMIAAHLAVKYPVAKLVLLNASVFYINPQQLFKDVASLIKSNFTYAAESRELFRRYLSKATATPPRSIIHFRHLIKVLKNDFSHITVPTLIIQGGQDNLVEPRSAQYIYDTIQSREKELHILPESKHIICHDRDQKRLLMLIDRFLTGKGEEKGESGHEN